MWGQLRSGVARPDAPLPEAERAERGEGYLGKRQSALEERNLGRGALPPLTARYKVPIGYNRMPHITPPPNAHFSSTISTAV